MEWVNITAKSLPEAIDLALDNLGVDEAEAEIEVLEEPRQGLFGRMRGNARVRARVKPKGTRPKVERGRTRKRRSDGEGGGSSAAAAGSGSRSAEGGSRSGGSRTRSRSGAAAGTEVKDDDTAEVGVEATTVASAEADERGDRGEARGRDGRDSRESRGSRSSGRSRGEGGSAANGRSSSHNREPVEEASVEEVSSQLQGFLSGLTEAFGFDGSVSIITDEDDGLVGMVDGRYGLMVGPRARTLDAIQELARVSVQRLAPSNIRIKVDVGGYREIRKAALRGFAMEAAAAVRLDGKERSLEPMSSADRKIVHDTLSEEPGIETRSAGNEPNRRVVVLAAGGGRSGSGARSSSEAPVVDREVDSVGSEVEESAASTNGASPSVGAEHEPADLAALQADTETEAVEAGLTTSADVLEVTDDEVDADESYPVDGEDDRVEP